VGLLASRPTSNLEDQGIPGPSPLTCPARVTLPVANATAGISLRIIWPRKLSHPALAFDKVEIPWRGTAPIIRVETYTDGGGSVFPPKTHVCDCVVS